MSGPSLADLGERVCVMGPSNSGKSTLAHAIGRARGLPVVHLDQLHHRPGSDWVPRPAAEFAALHAGAVVGERWVMEGNYSRLLPARLARATGLILLDLPAPVSLWRYVRRCWFERDRLGALEGARDRVNWVMLRHIAVTSPGNRRRYRAMLDGLEVPWVALPTRAALARFYRKEGLER